MAMGIMPQVGFHVMAFQSSLNEFLTAVKALAGKPEDDASLSSVDGSLDAVIGSIDDCVRVLDGRNVMTEVGKSMRQQLGGFRLLGPEVFRPVDVVDTGANGAEEAVALVFRPFDETEYRQVLGFADNVLSRPRRQFAERAAAHGANDSWSLLCFLLDTWERLEGQGFLMTGLDASRTFYRQGRGAPPSFLLDYRCILVPHQPDGHLMVSAEDVNLDHVAPAWYRKHIDALRSGRCVPIDAGTAHYAMVSTMFRLLVGRLPFDGTLLAGKDPELSGVGNLSVGEHSLWLDKYHDKRNAVFIFDPDDDANRSPQVSGDERFAENWGRLSAEAKAAFINVFRKAQDPAGIPFNAARWRRLLGISAAAPTARAIPSPPPMPPMYPPRPRPAQQAPARPVKFCPACGASVRAGAWFCTRCGRRLRI